jgi:DNA-binding NarL/FixJ family response regulator
MAIKTLIFEDRKFDQNALRYLLERIPEIQIIKFCDTPNQAIKECERLKPDLILADADIRDDKTVGPFFVKNVRKVLPNVKILGVTQWPDCLAPLKNAGCNQVVLKQFLDDEKVAEKFIRETLLEIPYPESYSQPPQLSKVEDAVLRGTADGKTEQELAEELQYAPRQVHRIKQNLFDKFGAANSNQLVSLAYKCGYLTASD